MGCSRKVKQDSEHYRLVDSDQKFWNFDVDSMGDSDPVWVVGDNDLYSWINKKTVKTHIPHYNASIL